MRNIITKLAVTNEELCNLCGICTKLCPVEAISITKGANGRKLVTNIEQCRGCTICITRCPEQARSLIEREQPLILKSEISEDIDYRDVKILCNKAHMYPEQVICYCNRTTAGDIARAILSGAESPEDIARMTGARTGCGVLCISGIIRVLRAAAIELDKAPGFQWYGNIVTIWDIPQNVIDKWDKEFFITADIEAANNLFPNPGGVNDDKK
jgi:ferredoxin